jgi:hypothetical protein
MVVALLLAGGVAASEKSPQTGNSITTMVRTTAKQAVATTSASGRARTNPASDRKAPNKSVAVRAATNRNRREQVSPVLQKALQTVETGRLPAASRQGSPRWSSDPFRLLEQFPNLHDLLRVEIGTTGTRRYMQEAASTRAATLTAAFASASDAATRRERNMARTVSALYIVSRASRVPAWFGTPITSRHEVALRASLRSDARARQRSLEIIEQLRRAAGDAVAHRDALSRMPQWSDVTQWWNSVVAPHLDSRTVTVSSLDATQAANLAMLSSGGLTPSEMYLLDMAGSEARSMAARTRLAALTLGAPAAVPAITPFVSPDTPLPREDLPARPIPTAPEITAMSTRGVEIPIPAHRPVLAAAEGTVAFAGELRGARHVVILAHEKQLYSVYSHLASLSVREGDRIRRGEPIGRPGPLPAQRDMGVHFEVRRGDRPVAPRELLGNIPPSDALTHKP